MIFVESPWPILLVGIVAETTLAILLLRTGQGKWLWAILGVGLLVLLGLLVERLVVTEREAVQRTLDAAVAAVEASDLGRLLECVSPAAERTRSDARWMLNRVEVRTARIRDVEITINRLTSPPTAKAKFRAIGTGRDRMGQFPYETFVQPVTVDLRKEGDRWLIGSYQVQDLKRP
jgi:hypothetical protein